VNQYEVLSHSFHSRTEENHEGTESEKSVLLQKIRAGASQVHMPEIGYDAGCPIEVRLGFGGTYCLHLHDSKYSKQTTN
jgi:hypothetical protein